jgi:transcription elongation factor GreA
MAARRPDVYAQTVPWRRPGNADRLRAGPLQGHWHKSATPAASRRASKNAEYHAAKEVQEQNETRIIELEDKLARAEVIDISKLSGDTIKFGATVTLIDEDIGEKKVWQIVGEPEADAKKGTISITSPLARALIGKRKGANAEVATPAGIKAYRIEKVEWR